MSSSEQKTEKPTPKRLREARRKGQVPFSRDATGVLVYLAGMIAIFALAVAIRDLVAAVYAEAPALAAWDRLQPGALLAATERSLRAIPLVLAPMFAAVVVVALGFGLVQTAGVFSFQPLKPQWSRMNPQRKLKQWFSARGLADFLKTLIKLSAVVLVAYLAIWGAVETLVLLGLTGIGELFRVGARVARNFLIGVGVVFFVLAGIDLLFQRWQFTRDQRMGKHEVKREHKDSEGDPLLKSHRRGVHLSLLQQDVSQAVQTADAVVVNPTHFAVALRYERGEMAAPEVAIKGCDAAARRIISLARRHRTPVVRNVPLARSLFEVEEGEAVPRDLYAAVAEVLMFVYRLEREQRSRQWGRWSLPAAGARRVP